MKRILITGAPGFVGANLARRMLADGHEVQLLVRPGSPLWRIAEIRADVQLLEVDLNDAEETLRALGRTRPEWVFHLAVHGAYSWQTDVREMIATNVSGTANLIEACLRHGVDAFVNTGSSSEYGLKDHAPAETEALEPNSYYAVTKAAGTMFCRYTAQKEKFHAPTLRLYSVFGPWEDPDRLLPKLISFGTAGKLPPLADPEIARDFVYVDDVVDAYVLAAGTRTAEPGPVYNVCTGVETKLSQAVAVARRLMDIPAAPDWNSMPNRHWDATVWVGDCRKIETELGWRPRHAFEDGFKKMLAWSIQSAAASLPAV